MWATCLAIGQRSGQRPTSERSRGSLSNRAPGEDFVTENADLGESGDNGYNHGDGGDIDDNLGDKNNKQLTTNSNWEDSKGSQQKLKHTLDEKNTKNI